MQKPEWATIYNMAEEFSNPQPQQPDEEAVDRLEMVEDRIASVEEELRMRSIEERLNGLEGDDDDSAQAPRSVNEGEEERELFLALAGLVKNDALMQAAAELMKGAALAVNEWTGRKGKALEAEKQGALKRGRLRAESCLDKYSVVLTSSAEREPGKRPGPTIGWVIAQMEELAGGARPTGCRKLQWDDGGREKCMLNLSGSHE